MHSPCDPPKFVEQDFSKFDFSRWHLDGLTLDSAGTALAGLADKLFNSEEWRQHFKDTLPELQQQVAVAFKDRSRQLQEERANTTKNFEERIAAAQTRSENFRKSIEVSTAPPVIEQSRDAFHLVARVVSAEDPHLGLSDIRVQVIDPQKEEALFLESITDQDGNAILTVPSDLARERDNEDVTLRVVDPSGEQLANLPRAVCIRLGQTETQVVKVADSAATKELKKAALEARSEREARAQVIASRADALRSELETVVKGLECRLRNNDAIIAELEKPAPFPPPPPSGPLNASPTDSTEKKPPTESTETEPSPTDSTEEPKQKSQKRRKKG